MDNADVRIGEEGSQMQTKADEERGGGLKITNFLWTSFMYSPLAGIWRSREVVSVTAAVQILPRKNRNCM